MSVRWAGCVRSLDGLCLFVGPGDQTGRPYIRDDGVSTVGVRLQVGLRFDKMSNEGSESAVPRTKIQFGGFRGPSQAIRKIHFVAVCVDMVSCCWIVCLMTDGMNVCW